MDPLTALTTGLVAGLALAAPLGAIGVLLVQEGASLGWVRGTPAAAAVAIVDLIYCATAVIVGVGVSAVITGWTPWPRIIGGLALIALAIWNLVRARASVERTKLDSRALHSRSRHRFLLFFGLTAINPATLVYFAAVVTALSTVLDSAAGAVSFVAGVAVASLSWQLLLVLVGAIVRWKTGRRLRHLTTMAGNAIVLALGILMTIGFIF